ncbi:hypothetical protein GCM10023340_11800 [Nocardioides marinquilinus]|uniref:Uncharacterized protein n=1 Tax=Nocardioides marinquilinus TaxID=1210400 RepID=A0ABP9PD91_9ACTN
MTQRHAVVRQLYVVGAALAFVGTFVPLFSSARADDPYASLSLWTALGEDGGGGALLGVVLVLAMVVVAMLGTRDEHGFGVPVGVLVLCAVSLGMLVARPGAGSDAQLGAGAGLLLGTTVLLAGTALADALMTPVAVRAPADEGRPR